MIVSKSFKMQGTSKVCINTCYSASPLSGNIRRM